MAQPGIWTDQWDQYFQFFDTMVDIYFWQDYVRLYARGTGQALCFVYQKDRHVFLMPLIKRRIDTYENGRYSDFETAYGYGGPLVNTADADFIRQATDCFIRTAYEAGIIAGFVRFHPLLNNQDLCAQKFSAVFDRHTVAMPLSLSPEKIWMEQIHFKHRNKIRQAQKAGLTYVVDNDWQYYDQFRAIYRQTMEKNQAGDFYFFDDAYFDAIKKFADRVFLGIVMHEDKVVSGALFFKSGVWGHYHLAGSLQEYDSLRPNNFLIYQTALYMQSVGVNTFHLGGGTDSDPENSLYKFKERFSKQQCSFYVGRVIINESVYKEICVQWEQKPGVEKEGYKNFLLKYRH
jgi:serine/alanine adding enzyme